MKVTINRDECIECGACEAACADVFVLESGEKAAVVVKYRVGGKPEEGEVPANLEACTQEAEQSCPVSVITTKK